ncbi:MAG: PQQ-binding-like beta-propeller repeat protein [Chitinophagaceae bacterium]|nr:PQQ-binding-like beta-propeller repeat protein [Oligoflexus sp.]
MKALLYSLVTSTFFLFIFTCAASAQDKAVWPTWGGDLENTHQGIDSPLITPDTVKNLKVKWVYETHGDVSAIPVVSEQNVYFPDWGTPFVGGLTGGSYLHALDRETGRSVWSKSILRYSKNLLNSVARSSFAISGDLLIFGDNRGFIDSILSVHGSKGASVYALNRTTGELVWKTRLDSNQLSIITQSPVIYNGKVYVGTASNEEASARFTKDCCTFRGSMAALDLQTGRILWQTYMVPEGKGFTGNAVWGSQPSIDVKRHAVYIATGNNYTFPQSLKTCLPIFKGKPEQQQTECYDKFDRPDNYASSVLALDLDTGAIKWARKLENYGAWTYACDPKLAPGIPIKPSNCDDLTSLDFDFGQAPMLVHTHKDGVEKDIVAVGQKNGVFWAFDPDHEGSTLWTTPVGPGGTLGGMEFGSATDNEKVYVQITNFDHTEYLITAGPQAGKKVHGGSWAALDAVSGKILWQTPDPRSSEPLKGILAHPSFGAFRGEGFFATDKGPMAVNNGVVFAGSMDRKGHMYGLDSRDGRVIWSFASGGSVMSAPAIVDNVLYWGSGYSKTGFAGNKFYAFGLR